MFTTLALANHSLELSRSRPVRSRSVIVHRDAAIEGERSFYWLPIGS